MIKAEIICDSLNSCGNRLTTFVLEYPRFIHSELLTHRMFSKNSASSRAIPIEKMIQMVKDNPAMPEFWGAAQSGMQASKELDDTMKKFQPYGVESNQTNKECAKTLWLRARDHAIDNVRAMSNVGLHKQIANRILEPWFHMRVILSATEFENFFALRAHKDAQPELQKLAYLMLEEYNKSEPKKLNAGDWHIPFGDKMENFRIHTLLNVLGNNSATTEQIEDAKRKIAIARCARISYNNFEGKDDYEADIKLCDRLFASVPRHLSPTEHVAMALDTEDWYGNFKGFKQYRYFFDDQNLKDERVFKKST